MTRENTAVELESAGTLRIGLVSDTHECSDPLALMECLRTLNCDVHIHLGDIGGARSVMETVREFKRSMGSTERLNERQREDYLRLLAQGLSPMRAYGDAILGSEPHLRERRRRETRECYEGVIQALSGLSNAYGLIGNVDKALFKAGIVGGGEPVSGVTLVTRPKWIDFGENALVFWPSIRSKDPEREAILGEVVADFVARGQEKKRVIMLGHEQLFKGPPPAVYKKRIISRGMDAVTIPWFEPNPSWRFIVSLFRQLPSETEVGFVFGHVHDAQEVIEAGIPALKGTETSRMNYRLYGLGHRLCAQDRGKRLRRSVDMFYVPTERVAVMTLSATGLEWEVRGQ